MADKYLEDALDLMREECFVSPPHCARVRGTAPVWDDLSTFMGKPLRGCVDLVTGGLPCQPFSCAGKQQGDKDERYIWPDFFRILEEVQASMVFLENVPTFVTGGWFEAIGDRLCEMGFRVEEPLFLAAEDLGAPHKRERVFIFAAHRGVILADTRYRRRTPRSSGIEQQPEFTVVQGSRRDSENVANPKKHHRRPRGQREAQNKGSWRRGSRGSSTDLGDTNGQHGYDRRPESSEVCGKRSEETEIFRGKLFPPGPADNWSQIPRWLWPAVGHAEELRWQEIERDESDRTDDQARLQRETESAIRGMANGIPYRVDQLRACGNGVIPIVAAVAFRTLLARISHPRRPFLPLAHFLASTGLVHLPAPCRTPNNASPPPP